MILENEYTVKLSEIGKGNKVTNKAILSYLEDIGGFHSNLTHTGLLDIPITKKRTRVMKAQYILNGDISGFSVNDYIFTFFQIYLHRLLTKDR